MPLCSSSSNSISIFITTKRSCTFSWLCLNHSVTHQYDRQSTHHRVQDHRLYSTVLFRSRIWFSQSRISASEALLCWIESVGELKVVNQHHCRSQNHHLEVEHDGPSLQRPDVAASWTQLYSDEQCNRWLPINDTTSVMLLLFCDSVGGKPCPSAPVNILNHLTPANQGTHSVSLNNL